MPSTAGPSSSPVIRKLIDPLGGPDSRCFDTPATKAAMAKDPAAAELDKKMNDYCAKNPAAKVSEAMEKVMMQ